MTCKTIFDRLKQQAKEYPWDFMLFIFLALLIPRIYSIVNTYWIGHLDYSALAIAEQYEFMGILIEIVNETIPFGILALVSQNYKNRNSVVRQFVAGLTLQLVLSSILAIGILSNMSIFVDFIGTSPELVSRTVSYLTLRTLALPFASMSLLLIVGLKSMDRAKLALGIVTINVAVNIVLDILLVSPYPFSLQLGLEGVAQGYLISNIIYFALALIASISTLKMRLSEWNLQPLLIETKPLFGVGGWTGIDSFIRNFFYFFVLQVLNYMGPNQYAGFQLFQRLMWTALIPVIAISQGTSIRVGNYLKDENSASRIRDLIAVSVLLAFLIIGSFGIFGIFAIDLMGYFFTSNADVVHYSSVMFWWQIIPYILFAISMNLKSIFYGTGKTYNFVIISLILNLGIIVPFFYMMAALILPHTFESVMLMFVIVDFVDILITYVLFMHVFRSTFKNG